MGTDWGDRFALRTRGMRSSVIRELLKLTEEPGIISFGGGLPAPEAFPIEQVRVAADAVLSRVGPQSLQYSTTEGYPPLREYLAQEMAALGVPAGRDNVLITTGSQQALDLVGKLFVDPGDAVLTENPTYLGAIQAFNGYQARYVTVPIDDDGMRVAEAGPAIAERPKLIYALPNFQNPAGVTMSLDRRRELVARAAADGIALFEDDPYRKLRYEGEHIAPLIALDAERPGSVDADGFYAGNVIYTSTFSKTLAPGLRLGWIVAPREVISRLVQMKQGTDLHTSSLDQMVAFELARDGFLDEHGHTIRSIYHRRRDLMLATLAEHFPPEVHWTRPAGGLFLWVTTPASMDTAELLVEALKQQVAFVPGLAFHANGGGENTMRLNFSNATDEMIAEGIRRMAVTVKDRLARTAPVFAAG